MEYKKPTILLIWGYHRKGWVEPFEKLNDKFDFVYIYYLKKPKEEISFTHSKKIYWFDYSNPYEILFEIKPDKVVFMSIDKANTVALNIACKYSKIPTFIFQHGLFYSFKWYLESNKKEIEKNIELGNKKWADELDNSEYYKLLKFLLKSLKFYNPKDLFFLLFFFYYKKKLGKNGQLLQQKMCALSNYLKPNKYIVFTKQNAEIFLERDYAGDKDLIEIGNPFLDVFFEEQNHEVIEEFFLLIDEPLAYVGEFDSVGFFPKEDVINFQKKLNDFALKNNTKLIVKLHPYSFDNDFYYQHSNIIYLKDADNVELIKTAKGIFGTNSTLLLPAVYLNKCVVFKVWENSEFDYDCEQFGVIQRLDFFNFAIDEIDFSFIKKKQSINEKLIAKYFYKVDGKATDRLSEILYKG